MSDLGDPTEGQEPTAGAPAAGSPPAATDPEVERLKTENAQYREQLRSESAKRLAAQHGLSETEAELLALVPRDQQEEKAKALAASRGTAPPASATPTEEPPEAKGLAAMQDQGTSPTGDPAPPRGSDEEILKRLMDPNTQIRSLDDLKAIQTEYRQSRSGG